MIKVIRSSMNEAASWKVPKGSKSQIVKLAKDYIDSHPEQNTGGAPSNSEYRKFQMILDILDQCKDFSSAPSDNQLSSSVEQFIELAKELGNGNDRKLLTLYQRYVAAPLVLRGEYKFTSGREWGNAKFRASDSKLSVRNLCKSAGLKNPNFWDYE